MGDRPTLLPGEIAHQAIQGQYVVLSYAVSYIGSLTTLELLHRRTGSRGWYNWSLLVGSAISMGSIAIWGMHFIGNRAIVLDYGVESHQLVYSASFTALSFFLPIIVLLSAYMFIGTNEDVSKVRVTIGGTIAGLAVVLMHYLGQFGVSNYTSVYNIGHVVGSVIIAIAASNVALTIFFVLRSQWAGTWWKRISLAFVLAGAVSGMHWLATLGTEYRLKNAALPTSTLDRKQTVIVVGTFCALTCACLLAYAIIVGAKARQLFTKVRKVTLSAVIFDNEGRLMVSTSGSLPTEVITDTLNTLLDQEFTKEHPVFLWFYRVSRSWYGVKDFVSGMQQHLRTVELKKGLQGQSDMSLVFREMLCVAAKKLSEQIRFPLEHIGVLYDEILQTGSTTRTQTDIAHVRASDVEKLERLTNGKGRTLFVYRQVSGAEVSKLQSHGYRFASLKVATDVIARSLQLPRDDLTEHLRSMRESAGAESILEPGVHVGCFAVRANIEGGFDVLVQSLQPNLIPSVQLPIRAITDEMKLLIQSLNGITLAGVLRMLEIKLSSYSSEDERDFIDQLRSSVRALVKAYPDNFWMDSVFSAHPITLPCRSENVEIEHSTAQMFIFRAIVPIHQRELSEGIRLSPFEFFTTQQRTFSTSRDHEIFARQIHTEFSGITERIRIPKPALMSPRMKGFPWPVSKRPSTAEKTLVDNPFASIMISQAVDVHSAKTSLDIHELDPMRTTGAAVAVREIEEPTWVEDYFQLLMCKPVKPM